MFHRNAIALLMMLALIVLAGCAQATPAPSDLSESTNLSSSGTPSGTPLPTAAPAATETPTAEPLSGEQASPSGGVANSPLPTPSTGALESPLAPTDSVLASPLPTPISRQPLELDSYFENYIGCFLMLDVAQNQYMVFNPDQCAKRLSPCSTFKIPNSLIGLETGVIPDQNYLIEWDGSTYPIESWNQDHTLATAIQNSVVWYYQELARRVGEERMQQYVSAIPYGNQDISSGLTDFWLDGSLQITAEEQISFLYRLINNDLPFSQRSLDIVKEITILDEQPGAYTYRGKTGSCRAEDGYEWGWFVGYVSRPDNNLIFATNIESPREANGFIARGISEEILLSMGLINP